MRKILLLIVLFGVTITGVRAQVGIGTKKPHKAAQLEVKSDPDTPGARGVLIPRVSLISLEMTLADIPATDKNKMPNSILIFNTNSKVTGYDGKNYGIGYYYWDETVTSTKFTNGDGAWVPLLAGGTPENINKFFNSINTESSTVVYNVESNTLKVKVGNGLEEFIKDGQTHVGLGGALTKPTTIVTTGSNTLAVTGLEKGVATDVLVVADPATGILRTVSGVTTSQMDPGKGNEGKVLTVISTTTGNVVSWTTIDGTNTKTIDLSGVAGDGLTYSSTTGMLNIGAGNGITVTSNTVEWGGELTKTATIATSDTTPFVIEAKTGTTTSTVIIKDLEEGVVSESSILVVDKDGKVKTLDPKAASTINYTTEPQTTGRKWMIGGNYPVKEITIEVTFSNATTVGKVFKEIQNKDKDLQGKTPNKLKPINIRAIKKDSSGETSIAQSGTYDPSEDEGELTLGMNGSMFTVTHHGTYYIVIEYYILN